MKEFPWTKSYPKGVSPSIDPDWCGSLVEYMENAFEKHATLPAFQNMGTSLTYGKVDRLSEDFASYLQSCGLNPGDKIALQVPNLLALPVALLGSLRAGLIVVNTNPLYTKSEMQSQFNDSEVKAAVVVDIFAGKLSQILASTSIRSVVIVRFGDLLGNWKGLLVNFAIRYIRRKSPVTQMPGSVLFSKALTLGAKVPFKRVRPKSSDVAFLQYTGGTSSSPRGALLTHRNILSNLQMIISWLSGNPLHTGKEIIVTALPLYHIFALTCNGFFPLYLGAKNILITNPRDMKGFCKTLRKEAFSIITGVNTLFNGLLAREEFARCDFSKLKVAFGGGMALQMKTVRRWKEVTGSVLFEGYGLTEASPILTINPANENAIPGTIGLPAPSTHIRLVDDDGNDVPAGQPGEIWARGPQIMKGYWNREEETRSCFCDGFLKTGDVASMDEKGFLTLVDRKKDLIIVSGFNVYPGEVEEVISNHPLVYEVGVVGFTKPEGGEEVQAFVVPSDPALTKQEIIGHCKEHMTAYKCPKGVVFLEELPKSNIGKVLRRELKEKYGSTPAQAQD